MAYRSSGEEILTPVDEYYRNIRFKKRFMGVLIILTIIALFLSFMIGSYSIAFTDSIDAIVNYLFFGSTGSTVERVVWELRIPRGLTAVVVGAALAVGGCVMQSMLRNPLADPYTTGVSSGAALGASISIVLGISIIPFNDTLSTLSNAFIMALIPSFIIMAISTMKRITSTTMILVGIGIMYIFSAFTQMLRLIANPTQLEELYRWQLGSLSDTSFANLAILLIVVIFCVAILYRYRTSLNLLSIGDESALSLGTNPWTTRVVCLVVVSLMTAVCVSFTGTIGFVGLVAPQMVRTFIGSDNRFLIPTSMLFGGFFLLVCDCASRVVGTAGVPVGVVTAIVGSPVFLYLLIKRSRRSTLSG